MKNRLKWLLDAVMLIVLVLMYQKQVISMTFHEAGGLALLGLFLVHLLVNHKWIVAVTKKLFSKSIPAKTRFGYLVNVLLLVSFALIGLSGIMISKQLFSLHGGNAFKTLHYASSAFALILMGIHVALHWRFITGVAKKVVHLPSNVSKPLGIVLAAAIFLFGAYSMANTSFLRWLSMPFSAQGGELEGRGGMPGFFEASSAQGDLAASGTSGQSTGTADTASSAAQTTQTDAAVSQGSSENASTAAQNGGNAAAAKTFGGRPEGFSKGGPGGESRGFSILNLFSVIAQYGSITGAVAVAAYMLGKLPKLLRKKKSAVSC